MHELNWLNGTVAFLMFSILMVILFAPLSMMKNTINTVGSWFQWLYVKIKSWF